MITLSILESPTAPVMTADLSLASSLTFSTNEHGFASLDAFVPLTLAEQFRLYDRPGLPHVVVSDNGGVVWEGRLEDVEITGDGVRLGAFGYQRALSDLPYTALWSTTHTEDWRPVLETDIASARPKMYEFDSQNRLSIGLTKNAAYTNNADEGQLYYPIPSNSLYQINAISFDWAMLAPADFVARCVTYNTGWGSSSIEWSQIATGAAQSGSQTLTFSARPRDIATFMLFNSTGAAYTYTGENGNYYLRITNLRVKTTTSSSLYADEIARFIVSFVNGVNSAQLQSTTALITSPSLDLRNEVYEDEPPADVLDRLAFYGDNSSPSQLYEWGVWESRLLHFRQRGSQGRTWYVDISDLQLQRTIDALRNSIYAIYSEESGRKLRTSASADSASIARYGLTRRAALSVDTTSSTQAGAYRDTQLQDKKDPIPRVAIQFSELYDASGARWPLWACRAMDTIVIRNLPPTLSAAIDRIRSFRVSETRYDAIADVLDVTPESPIPTLDWLVVRHRIGTEIE